MIELIKGRGSKDRGGGQGGHYWHVYDGDKRVGYVFINLIGQSVLDQHASIQIHINATDRGKGIGRQAYRMACEQSEHDVVYAYMRKSNLAPRRAAEYASFKVISESPQITMRWTRSSTH